MAIVIKRDGTKVPFDKNKIATAINKAFEQVGYSDLLSALRLAKDIESHIGGCTEVSVEDIQDLVENEMIISGRTDSAKKFMEYRYIHKMARSQYDEFMRAVKKKISADDVQNQNANIDEYSFGGRIGEASRLLTKSYALDYCMSEMSKNNHLNNEIYIHDLDSYAVGMHNCLSIPFDDLLKNGFNTRQTDVRPAQSINTAFQLIAVVFQIQSLQQFGGVSATHLDWTLVPYVRKSFYKHWKDGNKYICEDDEVDDYSQETPIDEYCASPAYNYAMDMTIKELYQAVEGMYHNLNTLQSRSGNQLPFTSINYGTCTLPEGRMVTKAILDTSIKGIGGFHRTSIFPCGIFQCMKGVNRKKGDPNYDLFRLALESTSKRLYPNYANVDWSVNAGYDKNDPTTYVSTMGCRTYNGFDINGMGFKKDGRGNIAPVTIILPTLAMEAKEEFMNEHDDSIVDNFMKLLDCKISEAKDMLIERFNWICDQSPESAKFMYENGTMYGYEPEEGIRSALKHGTLVIGQLGLAETLQILIGCDHTEERGMELAKKIEELFKTRCAQFKQEYMLNFGVYYTPAENLCYTAMQKFKEKYGEIPNVSDRDFFTNSMHIPVWKDMTPFEKIDLEAQLTGYSNAGCITYVELDSACMYNLDAVEAIVNYAMDKDIPYFAINVPNDMCMECGYTGVIGDECPECGAGEDSIHRLRRVTGYITGDYKTAFNKGKQQEVQMRVKHDKTLHYNRGNINEN